MTSEEKKFYKFDRHLNNLIFFVIVFSILILLVYVVLRFGWAPPRLKELLDFEEASPDVLGTFGDFVGGVLNPTVSLFAFYLLSQSIRIQQREFSKTNDALEAAHSAQIEQSQMLQIQRFENTFFALLEQHNSILRELSVSASGPSYSPLHRKYQSIFEVHTANMARLNLQADPECGHYFRILYQLLKYIATRCPDSNGFVAQIRLDQRSTRRSGSLSG